MCQQQAAVPGSCLAGGSYCFVGLTPLQFQAGRGTGTEGNRELRVVTGQQQETTMNGLGSSRDYRRNVMVPRDNSSYSYGVIWAAWMGHLHACAHKNFINKASRL